MSHLEILADEALRQRVMPIPLKLYHAFSEAGRIAEKTDLIEGVIIKKMAKYSLHAYVVNALLKWIEQSLTTGYVVHKEDPLSLVDSEPEPDLAVLKGQHQDYINYHPTHAEWVVEVALSSYALDQQKLAIYAAAGINECWLVLPNQHCIEVYTQPDRSARRYIHQQNFTVPESLNTLCGCLAVSEILPNTQNS